MPWVRRNAAGLLGLALAVVALAFGAEAYHTGVRRDEQARAIPRRVERGETELADQHRKSVAVLGEYVNALRPATYPLAVAAAVAGTWHAGRRRSSLWLTAVILALAAGAVVLAAASRAITAS